MPMPNSLGVHGADRAGMAGRGGRGAAAGTGRDPQRACDVVALNVRPVNRRACASTGSSGGHCSSSRTPWSRPSGSRPRPSMRSRRGRRPVLLRTGPLGPPKELRSAAKKAGQPLHGWPTRREVGSRTDLQRMEALTCPGPWTARSRTSTRPCGNFTGRCEGKGLVQTGAAQWAVHNVVFGAGDVPGRDARSLPTC
jgi:hypothetical protein